MNTDQELKEICLVFPDGQTISARIVPMDYDVEAWIRLNMPILQLLQVHEVHEYVLGNVH